MQDLASGDPNRARQVANFSAVRNNINDLLANQRLSAHTTDNRAVSIDYNADTYRNLSPPGLGAQNSRVDRVLARNGVNAYRDILDM